MDNSEHVYTSLKALLRLQYKARGFSFLPRQPIHSLLAGRHASRLRGRGLNFEELRDYRPDDDIRSIDWKATRRTGKPHVRVFTEERDRSTFLVVDQRSPMFFGSVLKMKSVAAAEVAALSTWRVLDQGDRVGAIIFNDTECKVIRPQRSTECVHIILGEIVRMNRMLPSKPVEAEGIDLNTALKKAEHLANHDSLVCVISDCHDTDELTRRTLTKIGQRNDAIVAFIHDRMGAVLPDIGNAVFSDGSEQLEVNTSNSKIRKTFNSDFEERVSLANRLLLQRAIPFIPISTAEDPLLQIQRLLGTKNRAH